MRSVPISSIQIYRDASSAQETMICSQRERLMRSLMTSFITDPSGTNESESGSIKESLVPSCCCVTAPETALPSCVLTSCFPSTFTLQRNFHLRVNGRGLCCGVEWSPQRSRRDEMRYQTSTTNTETHLNLVNQRCSTRGQRLWNVLRFIESPRL